MTYALIIITMAILAAASGGSLPGSWILNKRDEKNDDGTDKGGLMPINLTWLPEFLFAVVIGLCCVQGFQNMGMLQGAFIWQWLVWFSATAWAYLWMQTGHAAILPWDKVDKQATVSRDNTLTPAVHFICRVLGITYLTNGKYTESYVWAFAAVKGFLIGLPVGGLPLAALWPLGYEIGSHAKNHFAHKTDLDLHIVSEGSSGAGAGISCVLWLVFTSLIGGWVQ